MQIVTLQRRLVEVGRIRLGAKKTSQNGKQYPSRLEKFRLTSRDRQRLDAAAVLYGGEVTRWETGWELFTDTDVLPVAVLPGQALNQSFELWGQKPLPGGKKTGVVCLRRCDGETEALTGESCLCAVEDQVACKPTTRLSVVLTEVPGIGVWRVEAHGWNAAAELAGCVQLLEALVATGHPVRARLRLDLREQVTESETRHFVVPVLDIDHTLGQVLDSIGAGPMPSVGAAAMGALPAGGEPRFVPVPVAELPEGPSSSIAEQMAAVASPPERKPRANAQQPIPPSGLAPRTAAEAGVRDLVDDLERPVREARTARVAAASPPHGEGDPNDYVPAMIVRINRIADLAMRRAAMKAFKVAFGDPPRVGPDEVQDAVATIAQFDPDTPPPGGGGGVAPPADAAADDPERPFFEDDPAEQSETPAEQHARLQRGLMAQAAKAFPLEKSTVPRILPKEQRDRQSIRRHAIAWVVLGRHMSTNDMTVEELAKVTAGLRDAEQGVYRVNEADGTWTVARSDGLTVDVPADVVGATEVAA